MCKAKTFCLRGSRFPPPLLAVLILAACLCPCGCGSQAERESLAAQDCESWKRDFVIAYLQEPRVLGGAEDSTWDFDPLSADELQNFLAQRLPPAEKVPPDASIIEILAQYGGKRLVVIPEEAREPLLQDFGFPHKYRDSPFPGLSIGQCLQTIIASLAPVAGGSFVEPEQQYSVFGVCFPTDPTVPRIYVVCVTKCHLLIIHVPRDVPYVLPTPDVVDPKAEQWRKMKEEEKKLQEQWRKMKEEKKLNSGDTILNSVDRWHGGW